MADEAKKIIKTPGGYRVNPAEAAAVESKPEITPGDTFLSFPDSLKSDSELYKNCLHFSCVDPITTSGVQAMSTSYRNKAINYSKNTATKPTQKNLLDIYLYKPLMVTKLAHEYEAVSNDILTDIIKGISGALTDDKSAAEGKPADVEIESLEDAGNATLAGGEAAGSSIAGSIGAFFSEAGSSAKQQTTGKAFVTPAASMYKGTTVRTQAFNFKFNPRNKKDLESMAKIIYYFHYFSLPTFNQPDSSSFLDQKAFETKGATYYDVPKMWYIDEMFGSTDGSNAKRWTPRFIFGPAAITNIEYNMTPDEFSKTLKGTAADPAAVDLSITFTELIPLDSQQYNAQNTHTEVHNLGPNVRRSRK